MKIIERIYEQIDSMQQNVMNDEQFRSLYIAFDTFPAPKGAAVHIREFAATLFNYHPDGLLLALGNDELPAWQVEDSIQIKRLVSEENNFLLRTMQFYDFVREQIEPIKNSLRIVHFRDPWGGSAVMDTKDRNFKTVFEVNALPSVELPARYSGVGSDTLGKIRKLEEKCLLEADSIICPSQTIKNFLINEFRVRKNIEVIHNGAEIPESLPPKPLQAPENYLIYFGAVQSWQGIEVLFKAMKFLRDIDDLKLVLCVSGSKPRLKYLAKLAERMEISSQLVWNYKMKQNEFLPWLAHAKISLAPLVECTRNLVQGCCPLKIVESMAYSVPVVASDLPVVRELIEHKKEGWLVRPDRPSELARAIRLLLLHSSQAEAMAKNAQAKVSDQLSWAFSRSRLEKVYAKLG